MNTPNDFLPMIVVIIFANLLLCHLALQMVCALHGFTIYLYAWTNCIYWYFINNVATSLFY